MIENVNRRLKIVLDQLSQSNRDRNDEDSEIVRAIHMYMML